MPDFTNMRNENKDVSDIVKHLDRIATALEQSNQLKQVEINLIKEMKKGEF